MEDYLNAMLNLSIKVKVKKIIINPETIKVENELDGVGKPLGVDRDQEERSIDYRKRLLQTSYYGLKDSTTQLVSFAKEIGLPTGAVFFENTAPLSYIYEINVDANYYLNVIQFSRSNANKNLYLKTTTSLDLLDESSWGNLGEIISFIKQNFYLQVVNENKYNLTLEDVKPANLLPGQSNLMGYGRIINEQKRVSTKHSILPDSLEITEYLGQELTSKNQESDVDHLDEFYADYWRGTIEFADLSSTMSNRRIGINCKVAKPLFAFSYIKGFKSFNLQTEIVNRKIAAEEEEAFSNRRSTKSQTFEINRSSEIVESDWIREILDERNQNEWNQKYRWE